MPNHVTNIITFSGDKEQISRVLESIKNDDNSHAGEPEYGGWKYRKSFYKPLSFGDKPHE